MLPPTPRLWFASFDHANDADHIRAYNPLCQLLRTRYEVVLDKHRPEFLFYGVKRFDFWRYRAARIFYTYESDPPDFSHCDWALSNAHPSTFPAPKGRALYFPFWVFYLSSLFGAHKLRQRLAADPRQVLARKQKFCAFLALNHAVQKRNKLVNLLSRHQRVTCASRVLRNDAHVIPQGDFGHGIQAAGWRESRQILCQFYQQHKFVIAFENNALPGYVTEKLAMAFLAHSVPIYWGAPDVAEIFNPAAFIHARDFSSQHKLVEHVRHVHADDALYLRYLRAPIFRPETAHMADAMIEQFFMFCAQIFARGQRRARFWTWSKFLQPFRYSFWTDEKKQQFQSQYRRHRRHAYAKTHRAHRRAKKQRDG